MEKQINQFLIETLENNNNNLDFDNSFLDKYYELFDTKKYLGKNFDSIYEDMEQIYEIKNILYHMMKIQLKYIRNLYLV